MGYRSVVEWYHENQMAARLSFAFCTCLLGLVVALSAVWHGFPITAISIGLGGGFCGIAILLGADEVMTSERGKIAAGTIGAIGLLGTYLEHRAFDGELIRARVAATSPFVDISIGKYCDHTSFELQEISMHGLKACAVQNHVDLQSAAVDFEKGLHFGPALSLVDATYSSINQQPRDSCAVAFKAAFSICPEAFHRLSASERDRLLKGE